MPDPKKKYRKPFGGPTVKKKTTIKSPATLKKEKEERERKDIDTKRAAKDKKAELKQKETASTANS